MNIRINFLLWNVLFVAFSAESVFQRIIKDRNWHPTHIYVNSRPQVCVVNGSDRKYQYCPVSWIPFKKGTVSALDRMREVFSDIVESEVDPKIIIDNRRLVGYVTTPEKTIVMVIINWWEEPPFIKTFGSVAAFPPSCDPKECAHYFNQCVRILPLQRQ